VEAKPVPVPTAEQPPSWKTSLPPRQDKPAAAEDKPQPRRNNAQVTAAEGRIEARSEDTAPRITARRR